MICPMTKHFSQFWENTPFSSCIKFQIVWFLLGPGERRRVGLESGVCLSFYRSSLIVLCLVCSGSWSLIFCWTISCPHILIFTAAATHVLRGMDSFAAIGEFLEVVTSGDLLVMGTGELFFCWKNSPFVPFIVSCSLNLQSTTSKAWTPDTSLSPMLRNANCYARPTPAWIF